MPVCAPFNVQRLGTPPKTRRMGQLNRSRSFVNIRQEKAQQSNSVCRFGLITNRLAINGRTQSPCETSALQQWFSILRLCWQTSDSPTRYLSSEHTLTDRTGKTLILEQCIKELLNTRIGCVDRIPQGSKRGFLCPGQLGTARLDELGGFI